jgi:hypothetical protein
MEKQLVITIIEALEAEHVPHMLAGSFASMVYGIPRSTKDVDFVVELEEPAFSRLMKRLKPDFDLDPQQYLETSTWTRRYILKARRSAFKVEFFLKSEDAHHLSLWSRRRTVFNSILQHHVTMPTPEDVIVQKLRWGRPQDRIDAENVMDVQAPHLDWAYIEHWCGQHGKGTLLEEIRAGLEPIE